MNVPVRSVTAAASRDDLLADLVERPEAFDIGTALRVAEAAAGTVAVHAQPSLRLAARPVTAAVATGDEVVLTSSVAGLVGALGPLPPAYTELASRQLRTRARGLTAFFDVFATGLTTLFVAAGEKYRLARLFRWRGLGKENGIVVGLFALVGFGTAGVREANAVGDATVLRYAGLLARRNRSAAALRAILADDLALPVEIEEFRPRWLTIAPTDRTRMAQGGGNQLGVTAIAGTAVYDRQGAFRIVVGPVGYRDYASLAPGGARMGRLIALARLFVGIGLDFDIKVVLKREDVPQTRLDAAAAARLGWNAFVLLGQAREDSHDCVVRPAAQRAA